MRVHDWIMFASSLVLLGIPVVRAVQAGVAANGTPIPFRLAALRALRDSRVGFVVALGLIFLARSMG